MISRGGMSRDEHGNPVCSNGAWQMMLEASDLIEKLEKALKPFADAYEDTDEKDLDHWDIWEHSAAMGITIGDLRKAKEVLENVPTN